MKLFRLKKKLIYVQVLWSTLSWAMLMIMVWKGSVIFCWTRILFAILLSHVYLIKYYSKRSVTETSKLSLNAGYFFDRVLLMDVLARKCVPKFYYLSSREFKKISSNQETSALQFSCPTVFVIQTYSPSNFIKPLKEDNDWEDLTWKLFKIVANTSTTLHINHWCRLLLNN